MNFLIKMGRKTKFSLFFLSLLVFILGANFVLARELEIWYPPVPFPNVETPQEFLPRIKAEGTSEQALPLYVKYFYSLFLMISGLIALGAVLYGGFQYLISAGAPAKMSLARDQITGGILGLVILLSSYLILTTINPKLTIFTISIPGIERCDCTKPPQELSDFCKKYCLRILPPAEEVPAYIEIPYGRIIERVIKKSEEARAVAEITKQKAERLNQLTKELNELTQQCKCSDLKTRECGGACSGGICCRDNTCPGDPCYPNRARIDQLIKTRVIPPPPGEPPPPPPPAGPGCFYLEVTADYSGGEVQPTVCFIGAGEGGRDGRIQLYVNGGYIATNAWCGPCTDWRFCYYPDLPGLRFPLNRGESKTVGYYGTFLGAPPGQGTCPYSLFTTFSVDNQGKFSYTRSGGGPTIILAEIPKLIEELKAWRAATFAAKNALENEYTNLRLAEALMRDSLSLPINYDNFIALEKVQIKKISHWANIDIGDDPLKGVRNQLAPGLPDTSGEDPATFYVREKGNEELIKLIENVATPVPPPPLLPPPDPPLPPPPFPPPGSGACSPENLLSVFGTQAYNASCICQQESGGNPWALNTNCLTRRSCDYSVGLFQLNLLGRCVSLEWAGNSDDCIANPWCRVLDQEAVDQCKRDYGWGIPEINSRRAYEIYRYRGWCSPWYYAARNCGLCLY